MAWIALGLIWTDSVPLGVRELERWLLLLLALAALLAVRSERGLLAGVAAATVAVALWNLATRWGGGDTGHEAQPVGYGNGVGILCAVGLLVTLGLARERRFWLAAAAPLAAALVLSESKGAWLALLVGAGALVLRSRRALALLAVAGVLLAHVAAVATSDERRAYWGTTVEAVADSPVLGTGPGTWPRVWVRDRAEALPAADAHGDYLETLAELGPVGLALLLAALAAPLAAARRGPATAGYTAFVVHLAVDWDLEQAAVAVAGLACAAALLSGAAAPRRRVPVAAVGGAAAVLGGLSVAAWPGNALEARAAGELRAGRADAAAGTAGKAARLAPWAAEPWRLRGEALRAQGEPQAAAEAFREALTRDPGDHELWLALARATSGEERRRALERARRLNPLGSG